jgi:hypothetical protein
MPEVGIEPTRPFGHEILSRVGGQVAAVRRVSSRTATSVGKRVSGQLARAVRVVTCRHLLPVRVARRVARAERAWTEVQSGL